jgi:hypothetical protein
MTVPSGKRNWGATLVHVRQEKRGNLPPLGLGVDALVRTAHRLSAKCASRCDCAALGVASSERGLAVTTLFVQGLDLTK